MMLTIPEGDRYRYGRRGTSVPILFFTTSVRKEHHDYTIVERVDYLAVHLPLYDSLLR